MRNIRLYIKITVYRERQNFQKIHYKDMIYYFVKFFSTHFIII